MTAPHTGRRILVLDDPKRNRGLTREVFSPLGIDLVTARGSDHALQILSDQDVSVFVTDLQVAGVDFLTALRERLPDLPIIVMIGYNDRPLVAETNLGGLATTILAEPLTCEGIVVAVRDILLLNTISHAAQTLRKRVETCHPRVLLAEDDRDSRELLAMRLNKHGYSVTACEDGALALDALRSGEFDILITDIMMPRMDGIELTHAAKKVKPRLPVIMLSAASDVEASLNALRAGAYCYVTKPAIINELALFIDRAIRTDSLEMELRHQNALLESTMEELRESLDELRRQPDLQAAGRLATLKKVSANVAHELKNPLNSINASFCYVRSSIPENTLATNSKIAKHCDIVETQIQRSQEIIEGIMDFANPQALFEDEVQVNDLLQRSIALAIPAEPRIDVCLELDQALPSARGSERELTATFVNLIINAAKAMKNNGVLTIMTETDSDTGIRITFADTGPGLPAAIIDTVFEPFFTTDQSRGTGLELAICKECVTKCGGTLVAGNAPNGGAVFTITLRQMHRAEIAAQ